MGSISGLNSLLASSTTSTSTSSIDLSSLLQAATGATSSGIDVTAAVQAAVYAAQAPERQWQAQQSTVTSQITALTTIQTSLSSLGGDLNDLNDLGGSLASRSVSSTSAAVSATSDPGTTPGVHTISVQSLATNGSWYSQALPGSAALGSSTLTITPAQGQATTFSAGDGSLSALAQSINTAAIGVTASVISDANGSRLALESASTGAAADFTVSYGAASASSWSSADLASDSASLAAGSFQVGDGTSSAAISVAPGDTLSSVAVKINSSGLNVTASVVDDASGSHLDVLPLTGASVSVSSDPALAFTRASTGTNASLTVDGVPVSSTSNTVSGAVPGLTLSLSGTTSPGSPATLSVAADTYTIQQALSNFVSDYNTALKGVTSQFSFSTSTGSQGVLSGSSDIRSLQGTLLGIGGYTASATSSPGSITSLADLGITMGDDGSLSLDSTKLNTALANPAAVQAFFQGSSLNGFASQLQTSLDIFNNPANGSITQEIQNLNQQYTALGSQVTNYESGYIASQKTAWTAMYSQAEIALQQLPEQMKELQAQLGTGSSGN